MQTRKTYFLLYKNQDAHETTYVKVAVQPFSRLNQFFFHTDNYFQVLSMRTFLKTHLTIGIVH